MVISLFTPPIRRRARSDSYAPSARGEWRGWQIGPKIRIGGTLGKIGQNIKIATGKALENPIVDAALQFVPGFGPALSAAAAAQGRILDTSTGGLHGWGGVGDLAKSGAEGFAAGLAGQGVKAVGSGLVSGAQGLFGGASGASGSSGSSGSSGLNTILQVAEKALGLGGGSAGGGGGLLNTLLMGASIADTAATRQKQQQLQNQGLQYATNAYNNMAPLRALGLAKLTNNKAPDLSAIFADPANPFARTSPTPMIGTAVPVSQAGA